MKLSKKNKNKTKTYSLVAIRTYGLLCSGSSWVLFSCTNWFQREAEYFVFNFSQDKRMQANFVKSVLHDHTEKNTGLASSYWVFFSGGLWRVSSFLQHWPQLAHELKKQKGQPWVFLPFSIFFMKNNHAKFHFRPLNTIVQTYFPGRVPYPARFQICSKYCSTSTTLGGTASQKNGKWYGRLPHAVEIMWRPSSPGIK